MTGKKEFPQPEIPPFGLEELSLPAHPQISKRP